MSELRQDIVSGDWIILAPGRGVRPNEFSKQKERVVTPILECPFEDLKKSGNEPAVFSLGDFVVLIPNKYPILSHLNQCAVVTPFGPYAYTEGNGYHDVVITHDHDRNFPRLSRDEAYMVFQAFQKRFLMLAHDPCVAYSSAFHAWGPSAGASVYHPHYQILTLPIIPPDVNRSLEGSLRYFTFHKTCVHCVVIESELREKKRVVYENDVAVVIAPYASGQPFEMRIFPKSHTPVFEKSSDVVLRGVADALQVALRAVEHTLHDPDYNFFIHTAPIHNQHQYEAYHWHIEVIPKTSTIGGFEWSTGINVNIVDPDLAAETLRSAL